MTKEYLGDGLYLDDDGYQFILTAENGAEVTNTVYIDLDVWERLKQRIQARLDWVQKLRDGTTCEDEGCPHFGEPHAHPGDEENSNG